MGRPKGRTDTTPRKRRGSPKVEARQKLTLRERSIKATLREFAKDLWLNDRVIQIGLVASGLQLAYAFAYVSPWSWVAAVLKAAFVEISVWSLNRAIATAGKFQLKRGIYALWVLLAIVFFISTRANLQYEYEQKIRAHSPAAQVFSAAVVDKFLGADEKMDAWLRGGLLPLIVFGLILARRALADAAGTFERDELKRLRESERGFEYRERKGRETVARVRRAEAVGLDYNDRAGEA